MFDVGTQDVAFVEVHESCVDCPELTVIGFAVRVIVGAVLVPTAATTLNDTSLTSLAIIFGCV